MANKRYPEPRKTISKKNARRFMLAHHYLLPPNQLEGKQGILEFFERVGCVQFDTINVVGRNADLVLQARIADYRPAMLEELLYQERLLTDGWDKVASIYQTNDWPLFSRHRRIMSEHHYRRAEEVIEIIPEVLAELEEYGPISSLYFKDAPKTDWFWSATSLPRAALETLFAEGRVGVSHRVNTRRYFDLIERLVPDGVRSRKDPNETEQAYHEWHLKRRIGGMGLASPNSGEHWLGIHGLHKVPERSEVLERLVDQGEIIPLAVEGLEGQVLFIRAEDVDLLEKVEAAKLPADQMSFIAPLDNLIWNRRLIADLFDFEYVWEVYKPKKQREYGYYVLPVLYGDGFAARVDMKLDRKTSTIDVLNWWWQPGVERGKAVTEAAAACFQAFRSYLGADQFHVDPVAKSRTFLRKVAR